LAQCDREDVERAVTVCEGQRKEVSEPFGKLGQLGALRVLLQCGSVI